MCKHYLLISHGIIQRYTIICNNHFNMFSFLFRVSLWTMVLPSGGIVQKMGHIITWLSVEMVTCP